MSRFLTCRAESYAHEMGCSHAAWTCRRCRRIDAVVDRLEAEVSQQLFSNGVLTDVQRTKMQSMREPVLLGYHGEQEAHADRHRTQPARKL